jgi:phosphohistidine phosphatase
VRLILVRHAEAAPGDPDERRPLTAAGREVAHNLGARLADERPDAVVSSPLLRARETATPIAHASGVDADVDERLAPGATVDDLRAAVEGRGNTVVAVAHEPDCSQVVLTLTGREMHFAPGTHVELDL